MKNNQQTIKTYISEANQNRISDTLSVEGNNQAPLQKVETNEPASGADAAEVKQEATATVQEESHEPEALSAEAENLPPTAASADAEAVAGLPIGGVYGHEGELETEKHP